MTPRFRPRPKAESTPSEAPSLLARLNPFLPLVQAIMILVIGYWLNGRLEQAQRERQTTVQERMATVENLQRMEVLLTKINAPTTDEFTRASSVAQLSMYGSDALFPLFVIAVSRNEVGPREAIAGLRVLSVQRRTEVCVLLVEALKRPKSINEIRRAAIDELASELECRGRLPPP